MPVCEPLGTSNRTERRAKRGSFLRSVKKEQEGRRSRDLDEVSLYIYQKRKMEKKKKRKRRWVQGPSTA